MQNRTVIYLLQNYVIIRQGAHGCGVQNLFIWFAEVLRKSALSYNYLFIRLIL